MGDSLSKVEKNLKALAKRYESVRYSKGLAILFLMLGVNAFSEENVEDHNQNQNTTDTDGNKNENSSESISKIQIKSTAAKLKERLEQIKKENEKNLSSEKLELIKLMEQGDQVVKLPWSSWQFGANTFQDFSVGKYKGHGDKAKKYDFNKMYTRSVDEFERNISTLSKKYNLLSIKREISNASLNKRENIKREYGLTDLNMIKEPIISLKFKANVNPKTIKKEPINLEIVKEKDIEAIETVKFTPVSPQIKDPDNIELTPAPDYQLFLGVDSNWPNAPYGGTREATRDNFYNENGLIDGRSKQNIRYQNRYTLNGGYVSSFGYPRTSIWIAFKMWRDEKAVLGGYDLGYDPNNGCNYVTNTIVDPSQWKSPVENLPEHTYFNSFNFSNDGVEKSEFLDPRKPGIDSIQPSTKKGNVKDYNHQRFFVGGSRFIEMDHAGEEGSSIKIKERGNKIYPIKIVFPKNKTLHLAGPLTLGLVSQENGLEFINKGTITDEGENTEKFIIDTPDDLELDLPLKKLILKKSKEGFVGYKAALVQVAENTAGDENEKAQVQPLINEGTINFYGPNSIGMYVYLYRTSNGNFTPKGTKAQLFNKGKISLHGKESYGMKIAATVMPDSDITKLPSMINEKEGEIHLGVNGQDSASNSIGMILMKDTTIQDTNYIDNPTFPRGRAINKGKILVENTENSIGAYTNIDADITNEGEIIVKSKIKKEESNLKKQMYNIGMRSDKLENKQNQYITNAEVINKGKIKIDGTYTIGMLANGSKLSNSGEITADNINNGVGIAGLDRANISNNGNIRLNGVGETNNIGIFLAKSSEGSYENKTNYDSNIEMTGDNSTAVLVTDNSNLKMRSNISSSGNGILGVVVKNSTLTMENKNLIKLNNNGREAGVSSGKGSYGISVIGNTSVFSGNDTTAEIKVTKDKSIGLYSEGKLTLDKAYTTASEGAVNFFVKGGEIKINGGNNETGQKSLLFYTIDNGKIVLNAPTTATIKGGNNANTRGTAFYYLSSAADYELLDRTLLQNYFNNSFENTLTNLTLNMEEGARLLVASNVKLNLSDSVAGALFSNLNNSPRIVGNNYKTFMLYLSKLNIDKNINLDNDTDDYNRLELSNASIKNLSNINGTKDRQIALAQENGKNSNGIFYLSNKVTLENEESGKISLRGRDTVAMYAKRGNIINSGKIEIGENSTGIYSIEDNNSLENIASTVTNNNTGVISLEKNDTTGIYYRALEDGKYSTVSISSGGVINRGRIVSKENTINNIGMLFESPYSTKFFINDTLGVIDIKGDSSVGMLARGVGSYEVINKGTVKIFSSKDIKKPNIGMYTDKENITLMNNGKIESGNKTVAMYGYNIKTSVNSSIKVGSDAIAIYSKGGNLNLDGNSLSVDENNDTIDSSIGVYYTGEQGNIENNTTTIKLGKKSYGFVIQNENGEVNLTSKTQNVNLNGESVYIFSNNKNGNIKNETNLISRGNKNYGIYGAGNIINTGNINFGYGVANMGIISIKNGVATNKGDIVVGISDIDKDEYSIGMAAGIKKDESIIEEGKIINKGTINIENRDSIGMYAVGENSTATNDGTINLTADNVVGLYLDKGAIGYNNGLIQTIGSPEKVAGVVVNKGATLYNNGTINIDSNGGTAIFKLTGGIIRNYGTINISGGARREQGIEVQDTSKKVGSVEIKSPPGIEKADIFVKKQKVEVETINLTFGTRAMESSNIGLYIDTLRATNPINGLANITKSADLIIGNEASTITNKKYIKVTGNILAPYNKVILDTPQITNWDIYSASLTWLATVTLDKNTGIIKDLYLAKLPYTDFSKGKDVYNFLDGLEQRYGIESLGSRERKVFDKLNNIGNNEEILIYQAVDEMMGHQYANTQQRVKETSNILDKEFNYLRKDWQNFSKDSNKIKTFGTRGKYETNTAGVIDYTNNAYGVAYVHENETLNLGKTSGWYAGIVDNKFNFKDIGSSKEEQLQGKIGVFKSIPFDYDNSLNLTISGDLSVGYNKMNRRFLVVDEIFGAKAKYYTYAAGLKNELSKEIRLSEDFSFKPYAQVRVEYGKISKIKEKSGEMKLEVKANDYYSIKPEAGAELIFKYSFGSYKTVKAVLSAAYENELGKIADGRNQAKVADTSADYFNIRGEKENREGNIKIDLKIGVDNSRVGLTANVGYDTKGQNIRGGVGVRFIF